MPKRLSSTEIIRVLLLHGFAFTSQKGSHRKYKHPDGRTVIVPHLRKTTPIGTTRSIIRQAGLKPSEFGF